MTAIHHREGWFEQLSDALWRRPEAPLSFDSFVVSQLAYIGAMLAAGLCGLIVAGLIANAAVTVLLIALVLGIVFLNWIFTVACRVRQPEYEARYEKLMALHRARCEVGGFSASHRTGVDGKEEDEEAGPLVQLSLSPEILKLSGLSADDLKELEVKIVPRRFAVRGWVETSSPAETTTGPAEIASYHVLLSVMRCRLEQSEMPQALESLEQLDSALLGTLGINGKRTDPPRAKLR